MAEVTFDGVHGRVDIESKALIKPTHGLPGGGSTSAVLVTQVGPVVVPGSTHYLVGDVSLHRCRPGLDAIDGAVLCIRSQLPVPGWNQVC